MQAFHELTLSTQGISDDARRDILQAYAVRMAARKRYFSGFQTNQMGEFDTLLSPFLNMTLLNLGDSMDPGAYQVNSKAFERAVLDYYARLWHMPSPYWGYLTAMGSTEGNLFSLWNARDYLRGAATVQWPAAERPVAAPVVLYSANAHYSVTKACRVLQLATPADAGPPLGPCPINAGAWEETIPCDATGGIDVEALMTLALFFHRHRHPLIICLTQGTTFSGASDDWRRITQQLRQRLPATVPQQRHYWLHMDGALCANYLSFWPTSEGQKMSIDVQTAGLHSLCVSPYKWLSIPWPCGVVMLADARRTAALDHPHYIGSQDATLSGSRPGLSAVVLWNQLSRLGDAGQRALLRHCYDMQHYAHQRLQALFAQHHSSHTPLQVLPLIEGSLMVQFSAPCSAIMKTFSLSSEWLWLQGERVRFCHLVVLPHVQQAQIEALLQALSRPNAFPATKAV